MKMKVPPPVPDVFLTGATALISRRTGMVFNGVRAEDLHRTLLRSVRGAHQSPDSWLAMLEADTARLDDLIADITIGETYFFREPQQYAVLQEEILPRLHRQRVAGQPLRCWSAGCSSGEEPYTLAIILRRLGLHNSAQVLGTDLSRAALARARAASYSSWSLRGVTADLTDEYFHRTRNRFMLHQVIRDAVDFRYLNLADAQWPSLASGAGMDLILCRNVLIYFDAETIRQVARRLLDALTPQGWLLLGSSDPMLGDLVPCEVVMTDAGMMYRRSGQATPPLRWARPAPRAAMMPPAPTFPVFVPDPLPIAPAPVEPIASEPSPAELSLAEAERCYTARDYRAAAEMAGLLARRVGADAAIWTLWIRSLANQGELQAASRACAAGLEQHPTTPELHYLDAILLGEANLPDASALAARRALYLDRGFVMGHLTLAGALMKLGQADAARRALRAGERLLLAMPATAVVPASNGEQAGRLLTMARAQGNLLRTGTG